MKNLWTKEEDDQLKLLWDDHNRNIIMTAIPNRTWYAIKHRARKLSIINFLSIEDKIKARYLINADTQCWEWIACIMNTGYGEFYHEGKKYLAHRFSYELFREPIPNGLVIDHLCRNRKCINPDHLEIVTLEENKRRGMSIPAINARKDKCKNGHEFTEDNTYHSCGRRRCKICTNERNMQDYYRRKQNKK